MRGPGIQHPSWCRVPSAGQAGAPAEPPSDPALVSSAEGTPPPLDAWVGENGEWVGRVRGDDGRIVWIRGAELRQAGEGAWWQNDVAR
jgi:hypothetical protein